LSYHPLQYLKIQYDLLDPRKMMILYPVRLTVIMKTLKKVTSYSLRSVNYLFSFLWIVRLNGGLATMRYRPFAVNHSFIIANTSNPFIIHEHFLSTITTSLSSSRDGVVARWD
jgi:hypothetical protein